MVDYPPNTALAYIVDDNFHNRTVARIALEDIGYTVEDTEDSTKALETLKQRTFDLLILDLQMPTLTGTALFHNIKGLLLHKNMKIVVTTANPHMADELMQEQAEFILQKPFDIIGFQLLVKKISPFLNRFTASNSASV